ncbi:MobA/MobL family protein [Psychrobacter faecalis]|uniref:MobA/MobL family protein n=1 Tax=Psychrobacter faecalis TaxID=180588 RepID=UPI0028ADC751|nr:MobA/MobL family protein [Psychrobacter faecalis]
MAIFIASTKSISRGNGQSAVASASYRAGVELEDKRYGKTHDYSKKHGVMSADIILPSALADAKATVDRGDLWNKAEAAEKRKDARVAREWLVNLPYELSEQDRKELAHQFAQTLADRYGTIADCAIHQPTQKEIDRGADPRNFHAHIMFTTRTAELNDNNEIVLTDKATIELSDNKRRELGMERVNVEIKEIRQLWEQIANEKLAEHDHELIDSRSYADQGKDIEPQIKMGSVATKLERDKYESEREKAEQANKKGEVYEIDETPATIRGEINLMINERNRLVRTRELADLREKQLFIVPAAPTPEYKPSNVSNDELEQAESVVERVKQVRIQRQIAIDAAEALEKERIAQQQQDMADKKEHERLLAQEEARQAKLEQQRAKRAEEAGFKAQQAHISHQGLSDQHRLLKIIDQKSDFGQHLSTLLHLDQQMSAWQRYRSEPSTTDHQKQLADREQHEIGSHIIGHSQQLLDHIKSISDLSTRKAHTKTLERVFDDIKDRQQSALSPEHQRQMRTVSTEITGYRRDINRSRGMSPGF